MAASRYHRLVPLLPVVEGKFARLGPQADDMAEGRLYVSDTGSVHFLTEEEIRARRDRGNGVLEALPGA